MAFRVGLTPAPDVLGYSPDSLGDDDNLTTVDILHINKQLREMLVRTGHRVGRNALRETLLLTALRHHLIAAAYQLTDPPSGISSAPKPLALDELNVKLREHRMRCPPRMSPPQRTSQMTSRFARSLSPVLARQPLLSPRK